MNSEINGVMSTETFQNILREGKAERKHRAEQRRREDLQRIQDMKSKTGVDPLTHFPKEIWKYILDKSDPKSRGNMCSVHEVFHNLMESSKVRDILLPQVISLLVSNPVRVEIGMSKLKLKSTHSDRGWLPMSTLRRISKSTRDAVDELLDERFLDIMRGLVPPVHRHIPTFSFDLNTSGMEEMPEILKYYFDEPKKERMKRIIFRSIRIGLFPSHFLKTMLEPGEKTYSEVVQEFNNNVTTVLQQVGDQIWMFELYMCFSFIAEPEEKEPEKLSMAEIYIMLQKWLLLMPNLKWLDMRVGRDESRNLDIHEKKSSILKAIRTHPPPFLPGLEKLTRYSKRENKELFEMHQAVLRVNPHVKILGMSIDGCSSVSKTLPIETLRVTGDAGDELMRITPRLKQIWKLKSIHFSWGRYPLPINMALEFMNHFQTLEHVELVASIDKMKEDVIFLRLPNLVHFNFSIDTRHVKKVTEKIHQILALQFLLYCRTIKMLEWKNLDYETKERLRQMDKYFDAERMTDFRGGWRDLSCSNIWDVFPALEVVKVESKKDHNGRTLVDTYRHRVFISSKEEN